MNVVPAHMASQHVDPKLKVWQAWPGRHAFCCDGRIMVGPDVGVTCFAAFLTTATSVAYWIFICPKLSVWFFLFGCLLFGLTMAFMGAPLPAMHARPRPPPSLLRRRRLI
jgi:hypothetical protein